MTLILAIYCTQEKNPDGCLTWRTCRPRSTFGRSQHSLQGDSFHGRRRSLEVQDVCLHQRRDSAHRCYEDLPSCSAFCRNFRDEPGPHELGKRTVASSLCCCCAHSFVSGSARHSCVHCGISCRPAQFFFISFFFPFACGQVPRRRPRTRGRSQTFLRSLKWLWLVRL